MYLNLDEKGRILIPAKIRQRLHLGRRVLAEEKEGELVLRGHPGADSASAYVEKYAGKLRGVPVSCAGFDELVRRQLKRELRGLLGTIPNRRGDKRGLC